MNQLVLAETTQQRLIREHKERQARFRAAAKRPLPKRTETTRTINLNQEPEFVPLHAAVEKAIETLRKQARDNAIIWQTEDERRQRKLKEMRRLGVARHQQIILETASKYKRCGVTFRMLTQATRTKYAVLARQEAFWRLRYEQGMSLPQIGSLFGRDHTTVLHGVRKYQRLYEMASGEEYDLIPKKLPKHLILRNQNMEQPNG